MSDLFNEEYMKAAAKFKEGDKESAAAYQAYKKAVFDGKVFDKKIQELMGLTASVAIQCSYCIASHGNKAKSFGATEQEIAKAVHIGTVIKAGATQSYGVQAFEEG